MGIADTKLKDITQTGGEFYHFGVKGMRWGVRRSDKQLLAAARARQGKVVDEIDPRTGEMTKAVAGSAARDPDGKVRQNLIEPSKDYLNAVSVKRYLDEYGMAAVDNKDIQAYMSRIDVERRYVTFKAQQHEANKSRSRKFLEAQLKKEIDGLKKGQPGPVVSIAKETKAGKKATAAAKKKLPKAVQEHLNRNAKATPPPNTLKPKKKKKK